MDRITKSGFSATMNGGCISDGRNRGLKTLKLLTTTEVNLMKKLDPVTPGELLLEEFLTPMGISQYRLAKEIGVPAQRISELSHGLRKRSNKRVRRTQFHGVADLQR